MTKFVTSYKIPLALALLAVAGFLVYRHMKGRGANEFGSAEGAPSPYAAGVPRALGGSSLLVTNPYEGAGVAGPGQGSPVPEPSAPAAAAPEPTPEATSLGLVAATSPSAYNEQGQLTAEYVQYVSGAEVAPAGTTIYDSATQTTYDVSGTPQFSPGNYNPNSPAGVLAMNKAIESAGMQNTQAGGSAITSDPSYDDPAVYSRASGFGGKHIAI